MIFIFYFLIFSYQITLGQEDIETVIQFALSITESIVPIIKKKGLLLKWNIVF